MMQNTLMKRFIVICIILTMLVGNTVNMMAFAEETPAPQSQITEYVQNNLPDQVSGEISVEPRAETGKEFKMNIRLQMPRILTYTYDETLPPSQMYEQYKNVKVVIPLPEGVETVDPAHTQDGNIVINFPAATENDFKGETDKSIDIMLRVQNNGAVPNETAFTFEDAKWCCDVDVFVDASKSQTKSLAVEGDLNTVTHTSLAGDSWGILKNYVKTEEIGEQVIFTFDVSVGLAGADEDGNKILYSTATEEYNRYGRLDFTDYEVKDIIPELVQVNKDRTEVKTGVYPEAVTVTKEAVTSYGIKEQVLYDSQKNGYVQGTTKEISFNAYNEYDPNEETDFVDVLPQFTRYIVKLAYSQDAFLIAENEQTISTFKVVNKADLAYTLVGDEDGEDSDDAQASYVIRNGSGKIVLNKYVSYLQDGERVKKLYNSQEAAKYPMTQQLQFTLYEDKACTKIAKYLSGKNAVAVYDVAKGSATFDMMNAGTYYVKESGVIKGFGAETSPVAVTIPRSGGTATVGFVNKSKDFGSIALHKVRQLSSGEQEPLSGVEFKLYASRADAEAGKNPVYTMKTGSGGAAYLNNVPVGTYYAKETTPQHYEPNEQIYTVNVTADHFRGFLNPADNKYYGTDTNPIVNTMNSGMLYLGVVKWDLELKDQKEINYLSPSNQITPVASAYANYTMDVYYKDGNGNIVPYKENGTQLQLTTDKNGIIRKMMPPGEYYLVATGYDKETYTPWAQNNQITDSKYYMGSFTVNSGDDNYNLPEPDKNGNVDWNALQGSQDLKTNYNVIHNFSGMSNMSLKKLGDGQYVVPGARFDVYKIDRKGGALKAENRIARNVKTNSKAYAFFQDVEPGWYAFVETATGADYYLPESIDQRRKDLQVTLPEFDQSLKGKGAIETLKSRMVSAAKLVFFDNKSLGGGIGDGSVPAVGVTFKKIDKNTGEQLYNGAKYSVYYYENNNPLGNRVYLNGFYYKTNTAKNQDYGTSTYVTAGGQTIKYNLFPNGIPVNKTSLTQGSNGTEFVPAFGDSTTTMVGTIPRKLLGENIDLYVEELVPPAGYELPENEADRIKKVTVKGGTIDEDNVIVMENEALPPSVSITVAVSNRNYKQTKNMTSATSAGTFVTGSTVRLYQWDESAGEWKYVAQKNTTVDETYITESGATFQVEYGKTYAIAEKKTGNKDSLYFYDVQHKWLKNNSADRLASGNGTQPGTYSLKEQTTIDGWTLYGPITMPASTARAEDYKFTFYNLPKVNVWLKKTEGYNVITKRGYFSIYRIPSGKNANSPLSELEKVYTYGSNNGYETYKGAKLGAGNYVMVETKAPSGYSNTGIRKAFTISSDIGEKIPGTNNLGKLVELNNVSKDTYISRAESSFSKKITLPADGQLKDSLLGNPGETIDVKYQIDASSSGLAESLPENVVLEDSGLQYYAGQNGNGDEIAIEEGDYALTGIDIATDAYHANKVKAVVEYKTKGSNTWIKAQEVTLSKSVVSVKLGTSEKKASAFRIVYDNASIQKGFDDDYTVTVYATLYKRDILQSDQEIISVKNTANYTYDFYIYDEVGKLEKHRYAETDTALLNLSPTDLYPKVKINKAAVLDGNSGKSIAQKGDTIAYTLTLTNTGGELPMTDPVILDKLPPEVKAIANGRYKEYFNISMPEGITLDAESGLKEYGGNQYAALFFEGNLEKGQSITVTIDTRVKEDFVSIDNLIRNNAAASSARKGYAVSGNSTSASFKNDAGNWPSSNAEYAALVAHLGREAYGYISDSADNTVEQAHGVTIRKYVQGEMDKNLGYRDYLSNTTAGGIVNFKLVFQNTGTTTINDIRIADLLPQPGDGDVTTDRLTAWRPVPTGAYTVYKVDQNQNRTNLQPEIYTAKGACDVDLLSDPQLFGGNWKKVGLQADATAVGFDFDDALELKTGEYIVVEIYMTAPETGEYAGTFASNDAKAYYKAKGDSQDQPSITSNTVHTIYHVKPVGMGGLVFLDKDMDGIREEGERLIPDIPVKLHIYENGKLKETLHTTTDAEGRYYFDNLLPSYVNEDGSLDEGQVLYQYQAEFVLPEGTCATEQFTGGADDWKDNALGNPGSTAAPETTGDDAYSDNQRTTDSNMDVTTHKTEIFYLNPNSDGDAPIRTREAGYDLTYDAGLVRVRTIKLHKYSGSGVENPLAGAEFKLTGTGLPKEGITRTSSADGVVSFENPLTVDGENYRINYYGNYKIEEVSAPEGHINNGWFETIIAGEDQQNLTYDALNEEIRESYAVYNPKYTSLTISKSVLYGSTADNSREFKFLAIVDGNTYKGEYTVIHADGSTSTKNTADSDKGYILVKNNEKAVLEGLVSGTAYSVREIGEAGFTSSGTNLFGILSADPDENVAAFVNEKDKGYIKISKVYEGSTLHRQDDFTFNVKVDGSPYSGEYSINGVSHTASGGKIVLKGGQTAVIWGGIGQNFEVSEAANSLYQTTVTAQTAGITVDNGNRKATGTFKNDVGEVTFKNVTQVEGLYVTKELISSLNDVYGDSHFTFKLEVEGKPYIGEYTYYPVKNDASKKITKTTADGTFMITPKAGVHFESLAKGVQYKVTEIFSDVDKDKYTVEGSPATGTTGTNAEASIKNSFKKTRDLTIKKINQGNEAPDVVIPFHLYIDGERVYNLTYKLYNADGTYTSKTISNGVIQLKHQQYALIEDVPVGANIKIYEHMDGMSDMKDEWIPSWADSDNSGNKTIGDTYQTVLKESSSRLNISCYNRNLTSYDNRFYIWKDVVSDVESDYTRDYEIYLGYAPDGKERYEDEGIVWKVKPLTSGVYIEDLKEGTVTEVQYKYKEMSYGGNKWKFLQVKIKPEYQLIRVNYNEIKKYADDFNSANLTITEASLSDMEEQAIYTKFKDWVNSYGERVVVESFRLMDDSYPRSSVDELKLYLRYNGEVARGVVKFINTRLSTTTTYSLNIKKTFNAAASIKETHKYFPVSIEKYTGSAWVPYIGDITSSVSSRGTFATSNGMVDIADGETLTLKNIPTGTQFRVKELDDADVYTTTYSGFTTTIADGSDTDTDPDGGQITVNGNKTVTLTNSIKSNVLSSVNIQKVNAGGNSEDTFNFKVYINDKLYTGPYDIVEKINGTDTWTNHTMTNGALTLKGGQRAKINNLNPGTLYYVEEIPHEDYLLTSGAMSGPLTTNKGGFHTVTFTNTVKQLGLTISKNAVGADPDHTFRFDVQVKLPGSSEYTPYAGSYSVISGGAMGESIVVSDGIISMKGGESAVLKDMPVGAQYKVTEIEHEAYTMTKAEGTSGTMLESGNAVLFENTRKVSALTINKSNLGGAAEDEFEFTLNLDDKPYTGQYKVKDSKGAVISTKTASEGKLLLKGSQSAVIEGIPLGTEYTITEEDREEYEETLFQASGQIQEGENKEDFINKRIYSTVLFSKQNDGGNREDTFTFNVTVEEKAYNGSYTLIDADGTETAQTTTDGTITIKGGQKVRLSLPIGTRYAVVEDDKESYIKQTVQANDLSGFDSGIMPIEGAIETGEGSASGTTGTGTQTLKFVNVYAPEDKASLEIQKTREGGSPSDQFTFHVSIGGEAYQGPYTLYSETGTSLGEGNTTDGKITLEGGGSIYITDLEKGQSYEVSEENHPKYISSGTVTGKLKTGNPNEDLKVSVTIGDTVYTGEYLMYTGAYNDQDEPVYRQLTAAEGSITVPRAGYVEIPGLTRGEAYTVTDTETGDVISRGSCDTTLTIEPPAAGVRSVNLAEFTNTRVKGSFAVVKENVDGNIANEFTFTAAQKDDEDYSVLSDVEYSLYQKGVGDTWQKVTDEDGDDMVYTTTADGEFTLTGGQKAVFENIDTDAVIRVTETEAEDYITEVTTGGQTTESLSGELIVREDEEEILFTNTYVSPYEETKEVIRAEKILKGKDSMNAGQFTFKLDSEEYLPQLPLYADNDTNGEVTFDAIKFDRSSLGKEYELEISEVQDNDNPLYIYSDEIIYAKIKVVEDAEGKLQTEVSYSTDRSSWSGDIKAITNRYIKPAEATAYVKKAITGAGAPQVEAGQYQFALYRVYKHEDGDFSESFTPLVTASNGEDGKAALTMPSLYTREGEYYYVIKETGKAESVNTSISLSGEKVYVKVTVDRKTDENGNFYLEPQVHYSNSLENIDAGREDILTIENTYTLPTPVKAELQAGKKLVRTDGTEMDFGGKTFQFKLEPQGDAPVPAVDTLEVSGPGAESFGDITFSEDVGNTGKTYTYAIKEVAGTDQRIRYSTESYTAEVKVSKGADNKLKVDSITYKKGNETITGTPVFTNTYETVNVVGTKKWNDGGNAARPDNVTLKLYSYTDNVNNKTEVVDVEAQWMKKDGSLWHYAFVNLDAKTADGAELHYIVEETDVDGYTKAVAVSTTAEKDAAIDAFRDCEEENGAVNGTVYEHAYTITNTLLTKATGTKIWKDNGDAYGTRPDSITLTLSRQTEGGEKETVADAQPVWTKNGDTWNYTYSNLPKYTADGKLYTYTVEESVPAGYVKSQTGNDITNTLTAKTDITVGKKWIDNDDRLGYRPESVTVQLMANGSAVGDPVTLSSRAQRPGTDLGSQFGEGFFWSYTFDNLDKYDADGKQIDYSVEELDVEHYTSSITEAVENESFKIVNTLTGVAATSLQGKKTLSGKDIASDRYKNAFTFKIALMEDGAETDVRTITNSGENINFGEYIYEQPGTHIYKVTETAGTQGGMTYDSSVYYVMVKAAVVDSSLQVTEKKVAKVAAGEGIPDESAFSAYADDSITFNNVYETSGSTSIRASKTLRGMAMTEGQFSFTLAPADAGGNTAGEAKTYTNDAEGSIAMDTLTFDQEGTFYYVLEEADGGHGGITYDTTRYYIRVVTTDDNAGNLSCAVTYSTDGVTYSAYTDEALTFSNSYTLQGSTSQNFAVTKSLKGREFTDTDSFTFQLKKEGTVIDEVTVNKGNSDGFVAFNQLTYGVDDLGTHEYTVTEVDENPIADMVYDRTVYTAKVLIEDNGHGGLQKTVTYKTNDGAFTELPIGTTFDFENNYYEPVTAALDVTKQYQTSTGDAVAFGENTFTFELTPVGDAPMPAGRDKLTLSTDDSTLSEQKLTFEGFRYSIEDDGRTYQYRIKEVVPAEGTAAWNPSVTYSDDVLTASVTISKTADHKMKVESIRYSLNGTELRADEDPVITNIYTKPNPAKTRLEVTKKYQTADGQPVAFGENTFTFVLTPADGAPMPEGKSELTVSTTDAEADLQKLLFDEITFSEDVGSAGKTYTYTIGEVIPEEGSAGWNPSVTYSTEVITAKVKVIKDDNNDLQVDSITYALNGTPLAAREDPTITNIYTKPDPTETQLDVTKKYQTADGEAVAFGENTFNFVLTPVDGAPMPEGAEKLTVSTDDNTLSEQEMIFEKLFFTEDVGKNGKIYTYEIRETAGDNPSVTYSTEVITATVKVVKDDNNDLQVDSVTYALDGEPLVADEDATITNIYTKPDPTGTQLDVTKKYQMADGQPVVFGENTFNFVLTPADGAPMPEGKSELTVSTTDAEADLQKLLFDEITFSEDVGSTGKSYTYEIREVIPAEGSAGWNPSVTYSTEVITAMVKVVKDDHNDLQIDSITYALDGKALEADADPTITNIYTRPKPAETGIEFKKVLVTPDGMPIIFASDIFTFELKALDGGPMPKENRVSTTVYDDDKEILSFDPLIFSEDFAEDSRTYIYTIREIAPEEGSNRWNEDITYSDEVIRVEIKVVKDETNSLIVEDMTYYLDNKPIEEKETATITNIYDDVDDDVYDDSEDDTYEDSTDIIKGIDIEKKAAVNGGNPGKKIKQVKAGDLVTYHLNVKCDSEVDDIMEDIVVKDKMPQGLKLIEILDDGVEEDGIITWKIAELAPDEEYTVRFTVEVPKVQGITTWRNIAYISMETPGSWDNPEEPEILAEEPSNGVEIIIGDESMEAIPKHSGSVPDTGDKRAVWLWMMVLVASGAGLQRVSVYRRRTK